MKILNDFIPELSASLSNLKNAVEFRNKVKQSKEDTLLNGTHKDSIEWLDDAANKVIALFE